MTRNLEKVECRTPTPGKKPTRIERWKFEAVRRAILAAIANSDDGIEFSALPDLVAQELTDEEQAKLGSLPWYTTTVKLELEVRGEIKRVRSRTPQRLVRAAAT